MSRLPSTTFAMAAVDLSLPGGQDDSLDAFADHFPGSVTRQDGGSAEELLLRRLFRDTSDPHADYDEDIKPWLGDHVAFGGWLDDGQPRAMALIETTNDSSARSHLRELMGDDSAGLVVADGYAVVSDTLALAQAAVRAADAHSLADQPDFTSDMALLPDDEAMVGWVDGPALKQVLGGFFSGPDGGAALDGFGVFGLMGPEQALEARLAAGVHVTDDTAQLDVFQVGGAKPQTTASTLLTQLPDKTVAAFEVGDPGPIVAGVVGLVKTLRGLGGGTVTMCSSVVAPPHRVGVMVTPSSPHRKRLIRQLREARHRALRARAQAQNDGDGDPRCHTETPPPSDPLSEFSDATGLTLPDNVKTLLGDAAVVSYGGLQIGTLPDVALRSHPADLAAAKEVAERFRDRLAEKSGVKIAVQQSGDDLIVATTAAYADQVAAEGDLLAQEVAKGALGDVPDEVSVAGFLDLSRIWPLAGAQGDVRHLSAVGFWSAQEASATHTQVRLVVR
jgi:hypothetical protein